MARQLRPNLAPLIRGGWLALALVASQLCWASGMVIGDGVRVLYPAPAYAAYAQQVARQAQAALALLEPYFGLPDQPVYITLDTTTDVFNAFAAPIPRPRVGLRPLFPNDGILGLRAEDYTYLVLVHELTHIVQLRYTETSDGAARSQLGLLGEGVGAITPPWFIEGIAVYLESQLTTGGRLSDPTTTGLLHTLVLSERWPSLADISVGTYARWPGGLTRYLLGVGFVEYLIDTYGFEMILATLEYMNRSLLPIPFAVAWEAVTASPLSRDYDAWTALVRSAAAQRAAQTNDYPLLTESGWVTSNPALSPAGDQLAYLASPGRLMVASLTEDGLSGARLLRADVQLSDLAWLNDDVLVYSRIYPWGETSYLELFRYDLRSNTETRLPGGRHASLVRALPDGCLVFAYDRLITRSSLRQWCDGAISERLSLPVGVQLTGLDVSPEGRIALLLWQRGESLLGILDDIDSEDVQLYRLSLTELQGIHWRTEDSLIVSADAGAVHDLFEVQLPDWQVRRLSHSQGGVRQATAHHDTLIATTLTERGYDLMQLPRDRVTDDFKPLTLEPAYLTEVTHIAPQALPTAPYTPSTTLAPYGWLPTGLGYSASAGLELAATLYGQDVSEAHSYAVTAGMATRLSGVLGGGYGYLEYGYRAQVDPVRITPFPFGVQLRLGIWPYAPHLASTRETALGFRVTAVGRYRLDSWVLSGSAAVGVVYLKSVGAARPEGRFSVRLSQQRADRWGYVTRGFAATLSGVHTVATGGGSRGTWLDLAYATPLPMFGLSGALTTSLRAGYRQAPVIPLHLSDWAVLAGVSYRSSFPVAWRISDGYVAAERLTLEPALRGWLANPSGLGADITLSLDGVIGYDAPVRLGITVGYAGGFWYGVSSTLAGF
jgi:hypothetical protein